MALVGTLQRWGAWAGAICAGTYIFGFVMLVAVLADTGIGSADAEQAAVVAYMAENPGLMSVWYLSIYVLNGLSLAVLVLALAQHVSEKSPDLAQLVRAFGLIWATLIIAAGMAANVGLSKVVALHATDPVAATALWDIVELIENGIGGGNEVMGGVLAILTSVAMLANPQPARAFACFSFVVGAAGLLTVFHPLQDAAGAVFGLGYILWFLWIALILFRTPVADRGTT